MPRTSGFDSLKDEVKKLGLELLRSDTGDYFEAVIIKEDLVELHGKLKIFLGEPARPPENKISSQVRKKINDCGGLMPGQTLYCKDEGGDFIFAMLWPWQDGKRVTVKIIHK